MDFFPPGSRAKPLASALEMSGKFCRESASPREQRGAIEARAVCSPTPALRSGCSPSAMVKRLSRTRDVFREEASFGSRLRFFGLRSNSVDF